MSSTSSTIQFEIKDSGNGIPKEAMEKLFRIDSKIITTGTLNEKGSGLGLLLVKEFIEKNFGTVEIKSEVGNGTSAILSFPTDIY